MIRKLRIILTSFVFLLTIQLHSQTVSVSPLKLNLFYRGVDNPVTVVMENYSCKDIKVKASVGEFFGEGCHYNYKICDSLASKVDIYVGITKKGVVHWIDTIVYRIKSFDDPVIVIPGLKDGMIDHEKLYNAYFISVQNNSEVVYWILSYSVEILRNNTTLWTSENISGNLFQDNFTNFVRDICGPGDEIKLYNIHVTGKDCINRLFKEMKFKIK